jgi:Gpi18-like mannosyltransferase
MSLHLKNLKEAITNKYFKAGILALITIIAIIYILPMAGIYTVEEDNEKRPETGDYILYEINEDNYLCQSFTAETRRLYSMYFYMLNLSDEKISDDAYVEIQLLNGVVTSSSGGSVIESHKIAMSGIPNGEWFEEVFNRSLSRSKTYSVRITAQGCTPSLVISTSGSTSGILGDSSRLYVNSEEQTGSLLIDIRYAIPVSSKIRLLVSAILLIIASLSIYRILVSGSCSISKPENMIIDFITKYHMIILYVAVAIIAFGARLCMFDDLSSDYIGGYGPWYDEIKENGDLSGLVGDYTLLYQTFILLMTKIDINPLYGYKLFSVFFDYLLAIGSALLVNMITTKEDTYRKYKTFAAFAIVLLSPSVTLNSGSWAQCDAIYTAFIVFCLLCLEKKHYFLMFVVYGLAFSFKQQAILLLPFILLVWFVTRAFSLLYFAIIPLVMEITSIPGILAGHSIETPFTIYLDQQAEFPHLMTVNYPGFFSLLAEDMTTPNVPFFRTWQILFTAIILLILCAFLFLKKVELNGKMMVVCAFITTYTCVLFLPVMHERYGMIYEILAIIIMVLDIRFAPIAITANWIGLCVNCKFLFALPVNLPHLAIVNTLCYLAGLYYTYKLIENTKKSKNEINVKA